MPAITPEYDGHLGHIESYLYPARAGKVNTGLPAREQWPMLGRVGAIYRTEISARDIV
jgi:hypothetical protein